MADEHATMSLPRWIRDRPTKSCRLSAWGGKPHTIRRIGPDLYEIDRSFETLTATGGGVLRNYPLECAVILVPDK